MDTQHKIYFHNSAQMIAVTDQSVDLVVTSPPYPMIKMWDVIFGANDPKIETALNQSDGPLAFERMHRQLDLVWDEVYRVLKPGGAVCINIGDATRTLNSRFALYPNHSRIQNYMLGLGFSALPAILWRKQTNAPNKFMGSGMLPPGAYVTLEHEYILLFRKGDKREFKSAAEKENRRTSAYFWEERNLWFSDIWLDLKGTTQRLFEKTMRTRSGAFPFELPFRLINMFSVKNDLVLDPFLGLGTTVLAAMAAARNSIGYEFDPNLEKALKTGIEGIIDFANQRIGDRLGHHLDFVKKRVEKKGPLRYRNKPYGFPVVTNQETGLFLNALESVTEAKLNSYCVRYAEKPQEIFVQDPARHQEHADPRPEDVKTGTAARGLRARQQKLF
jgi:modification methylase